MLCAKRPARREHLELGEVDADWFDDRRRAQAEERDKVSFLGRREMDSGGAVEVAAQAELEVEPLPQAAARHAPWREHAVWRDDVWDVHPLRRPRRLVLNRFPE